VKNELQKTQLKMLAEIKQLFGPPAVVGAGHIKTYNKMLLAAIACFMPKDLTEQMFTRQHSEWEILCYGRHKALLTGRNMRLLLQVRAQGLCADQDERTQACKLQEAETHGGPPAGFAQARDGESLSVQTPSKLGYADALKIGIELEAHLDRQLNAAIGRRDAVLKQFADRLYNRARGVEEILAETPRKHGRLPFDSPANPLKVPNERPATSSGGGR
jgi:hypothetical protein